MYAVPAAAANGAVARIVVDPATFFCTTRFEPSMNALYQLFPSVHRSTVPRLLFENALIDPVADTSASETAGPSTAL